MIAPPPLEILDGKMVSPSVPAGPLHAQLRQVLRLAIEDHFEDGQLFWPENKLIDRLRLSPNTVRRALVDLAQEGVLERKVAKGSFVRKHVKPAVQGITLIAEQNNSSFHAELTENLQRVCRQKNRRFQLHFVHQTDTADEVLAAIDSDSQRDHFVLLVNSPELLVGLWDGLIQRERRVVCFDRPVADRPAHFIGINNPHGIQLAMQQLQTLGHERIVFLSNEPNDHPSVISREETFLALVDKWQLKGAQLIRCGTRTWSDSGLAALRFMPQVWEARPTALITASDMGAFAALHWFAENGISVPKQVSVIGFNNERAGQFTYPPLTSVAQSTEMLDLWALELLDNYPAEPKEILLEPTLVQRRSTGPVPR